MIGWAAGPSYRKIMDKAREEESDDAGSNEKPPQCPDEFLAFHFLRIDQIAGIIVHGQAGDQDDDDDDKAVDGNQLGHQELGVFFNMLQICIPSP